MILLTGKWMWQHRWRQTWGRIMYDRSEAATLYLAPKVHTRLAQTRVCNHFQTVKRIWSWNKMHLTRKPHTYLSIMRGQLEIFPIRLGNSEVICSIRGTCEFISPRERKWKGFCRNWSCFIGLPRMPKSVKTGEMEKNQFSFEISQFEFQIFRRLH